MASPTAAELESMFQKAVALLDHHLVGLTVETDLDAYEAVLESDFVAAQAQGATSFRQAVSRALEAGADVLAPALRAWCYHAVAAPEEDVQNVLSRLYDYMYSNNKAVKSRGVTFGAYTGSVTGTGAINRCTTDHRGFNIESITPEVKTAECVQDAQSGALPHEEVFEFRGQARKPHVITVAGSGIKTRLAAVTSRQSLLANPSFESYTGTTPSAGSPQTPTAVTDWTVDTIGSTQLDADRYYKQLTGQTLPLGLRFTGNNGIQQALTVNNVAVARFTPYYLEVAVYRESNCDGTLTLTLGSQSTAVSMSSLTNSAWNVVRLSTGADTKPWPPVWNQNGAYVRVALASRTTGTCVLDEVVLREYYALDGAWVLPVGGNTKYVLGDTQTSTDTIASDSKCQKHLWRLFGRYLPHRPNATQVTASGGRTLTFANSGSADTITASSGSFVSDGYAAGMLVTIAGTSSNNMTTGPIATVSATVLTFDSTTSLANEGPLSATATLDATASITDPA